MRQVADLMSRQVATIRRNDKLSMADVAMSRARIRHLPVLDDEGEEVVGVISRRDIFRGALARTLGYGEHARERLFSQLTVKELMTNEVVQIRSDAPLEQAARTMIARKIGCLLVIDAGRLVGILTEGDFVKAFAGGEPAGPDPGAP